MTDGRWTTLLLLPFISLQERKSPNFSLNCEKILSLSTQPISPETYFNLASLQISQQLKQGNQWTACGDNNDKGHFQQEPVNWTWLISQQTSAVGHRCSDVVFSLRNRISLSFFFKEPKLWFEHKSTSTCVLLWCHCGMISYLWLPIHYQIKSNFIHIAESTIYTLSH